MELVSEDANEIVNVLNTTTHSERFILLENETNKHWYEFAVQSDSMRRVIAIFPKRWVITDTRLATIGAKCNLYFWRGNTYHIGDSVSAGRNMIRTGNTVRCGSLSASIIAQQRKQLVEITFYHKSTNRSFMLSEICQWFLQLEDSCHIDIMSDWYERVQRSPERFDILSYHVTSYHLNGCFAHNDETNNGDNIDTEYITDTLNIIYSHQNTLPERITCLALQICSMLDVLLKRESDCPTKYAPLHWRVKKGHDRVMDAFQKLIEKPRSNWKLSSFVGAFNSVFKRYGNLFDAWHPLHAASLSQSLTLPYLSDNVPVEVRYYEPKMSGFICPTYVKEGKSVGMTNYRALGTNISIPLSQKDMAEIYSHLLPFTSDTRVLQTISNVFLNGNMIGRIDTDTYHRLSNTNIHANSYIDNSSNIWIEENGGLLTRNQYDKAGNIVRIINHPSQWFHTRDWDAYTQDDAVSYLGVMGSSIPFVNHNGGVRGMFVCNQRKSAACENPLDLGNHFVFKLVNPETPRVMTTIEKQMSIKDGANVVVAIMPFHGLNNEDAIVACKEAVELGELEAESIECHSLSGDVQLAQGIAEGSIVKHRQVIAVSRDGNRVLDELIYQNAVQGTILSIKKEFENGTAVSSQTKIRIRVVHPLRIGDKLASRHGQKGVVSSIVPFEELPYMEGGMRPSLIIGIHGFPSRMTIGQLIEGSFRVKSGCEVVVRQFDGIDGTLAGKDGTVTLYNPNTFEPYPNKVFCGCVYMMRLYHMVHRKITSRGIRGKVDPLTRQPVGARKKGGGLRVGTMETTLLQAHSAKNILRESMTKMADGISTRYCTQCHRFDYKVPDNKKDNLNDITELKVRTFCNHNDSHVNLSTTQTQMQLWEEMLAVGIQPKINLS